MDIIIELLKVVLSIGLIVFVLLAIAALFIVIFKVATSMDDRLSDHH